ncbi:4Fe-4S dicluster domain-containing protein [Butyricicoccus sp. Marseille-Q5471]|uniref:4Fe-4S dicluster domain-containing protein n=1 Tax=Butyricicoccus sp. Marseille-Q5471 TaxID=3039493 RepID=UPI0024BCFDFD|nr:4Fe-4S dicluster domain-containing protein [Butyricicoccus sp. Marseille-Q5471]
MNLIEAVKAAGIVGAGGAGFPTHVKLNAKAEWFIVNAAECEPLIETDKYLCRTFADRVVAAAMAISAHLEAEHTVIALKRKYTAEIAALRAVIDKTGVPVTLVEMDTFYPAGDEQTLVQLVTGRSVPERGLPLNVGAVVDNVGTLLNIEAMLTRGEPVTEKYLSVVGEVREPIMLRVPIGTAITACIEAAAPNLKEYAIIIGGPMMGKVVADPEAISKAVVTKTTGNIIVLSKDHYLIQRAQRPIERIRVQARSACIQCRMCTDLCPRYLIGHQMHPHLVMRNLYREPFIEDKDEFLHAFGDAANCCSCGVCEMFACPMGLSPCKVNEYIKVKLRERGIDVPKNAEPQAKKRIEMHRIPTARLIARLGLADYNGLHAHTCIDLAPDSVFVPFSQHIGKPAVAVKHAGENVEKGELLAAAAEGGLSANIHASVSGVITEISAAGATIVRHKEA